MRDVPASKYAEDAGPFISLGNNIVCGGGQIGVKIMHFWGFLKLAFCCFLWENNWART